MEKNKKIMTFLIALALLIVTTNLAKAEMVSLIGEAAGGYDQYEINGAWFYNVNAASTGSGVIQSFVRINGGDSEQGYNTDARPVQYDENTSPVFTRSLLLSMVPTVNLDGVLYREFLLDINQNNTGDGRLLSLDKLEIYLADQGDLTGHPTGLGTLIYEMGQDVAGADNWILMDYSLNNGSGSGDLFAYIPNSLFVGGSYVYLYSMFGASNNGAHPNTASFEEWAVRKGVDTPPPPPPPVPVPGAAVLGMIGIFIAGKKLRKYA